MEIRLDGKVALVTGASRGIGLAIAARMAEAGASVVLTARKPDELRQAAASLGADPEGSALPAAPGAAGASTGERPPGGGTPTPGGDAAHGAPGSEAGHGASGREMGHVTPGGDAGHVAPGLETGTGGALPAPSGVPGVPAVVWFAANAGEPDQAEACIAATVARFGRLDVLVNNAATNPHYGPLMGIDAGQAAKTVQVNQYGVLAWTQAAWRASMAERGGVVLNISSVGGLSPEPGMGWYGVTKAAVVHLTRQLAAELGPTVRVNAIAPGLVRTAFARVLVDDHGDRVAAHLPLRRIGEPDDVATAALFLASDAASWITGATLVVDGGALSTPSGGV
ncbi:MAG: SDR family oxidoreductase [Actinomycetota bacterium]|jgi:NAD(P)-dependent dehydrogenase (short-subunit alcohol dehydrogenase family)|nr:SDR family oxidoreductase [Actinomycetota bacterium]